MEKQQREYEERQALAVQKKPEIVIEGVRATSRQIALKEKEAMQQIQEQKRRIESKYETPKKPKNTKRSNDANPQAANDKAPMRKTEYLPENSPQLIRDQLMQSFSNQNGDVPSKINWAIFTRCQ